MLPPLDLLNYLYKKNKEYPDWIPYIDLSLYCVPGWSKNNRLVKKREKDRKLEQAGVDEFTRRAHAAQEACTTAKIEDNNSISLSNWHNYLQIYSLAISIVGTRLTPGILLSHPGTLMQIMEALVTRKDVMYKNAFLMYDMEKRKEWEYNAEHEVPGWSLSESARKLDTTLLARVERECVRGSVDDKPYNAKVVKTDLSKVRCYNCQRTGHYSKTCRFPKYVSTGAAPTGYAPATYNANANMETAKTTAIVPFQPHAGEDRLAAAIGGAFKGKGKGDAGKGKKAR
jgi:hypothetical protein